MGFGQAVKSYFTNYVNFKGRARRSEYWFATLFVFIVSFPVALFSGQIDPYTGMVTYGPLYYIAQVVFFLPSLAVVVRRLHDSDKSGWFILVPIYNLILTFTDSTPGPNRFGPATK